MEKGNHSRKKKKYLYPTSNVFKKAAFTQPPHPLLLGGIMTKETYGVLFISLQGTRPPIRWSVQFILRQDFLITLWSVNHEGPTGLQEPTVGTSG